MRNVEVRVKLSPEIHSDLSALATRRGLLPASLAAVIVGEYLDKYMEQKQLMSKALDANLTRMADSFTGDALQGLLSSPVFQELTRDMVVQSIQTEGVNGRSEVSSAGPQDAAQGAR